MGDLAVATVGEIAAPIRNALVGGPFGSNLTSRDYVDAGVPVIRGTNLGGGRWVGGEFAFVSPKKADSLSGNCAAPGDIVFTQRGTLGQVALVPSGSFDRYLVSQSQMKLTVDERKADALYLYYVFRSGPMQDYIRQNAIQTGVPHTNLGILRETPVPLPELTTQRAIAATLGALDDKLESNRRAIELIEDLGGSLLESRLNVDVYGFPEYDSRPLGDFLSVVETGARPKGGVAGIAIGVASLGAENIQSAGVVAAKNFKKVPTEFAATMKRGRLVDEDVLVYKDGGKPGNFIPHVSAFGHGFPVAEATINEHVYRVRAVEEISQGLLYWLLRSPWMDQEMRKRGTGVAIPGLNSTNFRDLPFPLLEDNLAAELNIVLKPMLAAMLRLGAENQRLAALRDGLLPELLSGRIRVPEASEAMEAFE